jgi:hypothetical protein
VAPVSENIRTPAREALGPDPAESPAAALAALGDGTNPPTPVRR